MNETLEGIARVLFRSWFIDFDPVRAKAEGREPVGLSGDVATLFPDSFEHSSAGLVPRGWRDRALREVADVNACTLRPADRLDSIDYIEISAVKRGDIHEVVTYMRGAEPSRARRRLRHGDTALSTVRPERSAYFLALHPHERLIASTGFAVVSPTAAPWSFLHAALTQEEVFEELGRLADGGAYPAIRPSVVEERRIMLPCDQSLLEAYHSVAAPLYERASCNRRESDTLALLRDALLPKLLSGELRVGDPGLGSEMAP
ncbi:MAG: hypothetical protein M3P51_15135 [Chloroflexota bacterium]|nr:hypothetical protein [Chloroflexota bacterium]